MTPIEIITIFINNFISWIKIDERIGPNKINKVSIDTKICLDILKLIINLLNSLVNCSFFL